MYKIFVNLLDVFMKKLTFLCSFDKLPIENGFSIFIKLYLLHLFRESKMIRGSSSSAMTKDAAFGDGVYFTRLNPATEKKKLAQNNWRTFPTFQTILYK